MAKQNGQSRNTPSDPRFQFFPAKKRKVVLENWKPKLNREDERRVLFNFRMTITGQSLVGFPEFLNEGFHAVEKERAGGIFTSDTELPAMALDYYDLEESAQTVTKAVGVNMQGLTLSREKDGESYVTVLRYHYTVPWWRGLWKFVDTYWGKTLWCDFTPSPDYVPEQDGDSTKQMRLGESSDDMPDQTAERAEAVAGD